VFVLASVFSWIVLPYGTRGEGPVVRPQTEGVPTFKRDPSWPKPLPNNWGLGVLWGVGVGPNDHVYALNATDGHVERLYSEGKIPAPPILEWDPNGNLVKAWGGRDQGFPWFYQAPPKSAAQGLREHGINVDPQGNLWVAGGNHLVLKFSPQGKFLLQLGERNMTSGSNHPTHLGAPASVGFYPPTNEVFVADGYLNRRVVVYDATTGKYKRHWGRYGKPPDDSFEPHPGKAYANEPSPGPGTYPRFAHSAEVSKDGLVYVADRAHLRTWVFKVDGTFVKEAPTPNVINSYAFSADPEQYYLYGGGVNRDRKIYIFRRSDLQLLGEFAADGQQYFMADSKGNLFICGQPGSPQPQKLILTSCPRKRC
jgi:hypothetical protein